MGEKSLDGEVLILQDTINSVYLGNNVNAITEKNYRHTPSRIQADTLFTFMTRMEFLVKCIEKSMLSPRFCEEDISYLKIPKYKKVAFPMKCFCDINMHRLDEHLSWYGYYGLAFTKAWGMQRGIQPIQYINPDSDLRKSFSKAFAAALKADSKNESKAQCKLKDYILHEMMYYKPYEGRIKNRNTGKNSRKCFTDECEWRFIPDVKLFDFQEIYIDKTIINSGALNEYSNYMNGVPEVSLSFEYSDIKYIIVKTNDDLNELRHRIAGLGKTADETYQLISKVIVWDNSKGDF